MISRRKTILTIILSVFLVVAFMVVTLAANRLIFADKVRTRDAKKLEAINRMLEDLSSSLSDAERNAAEQYEVNATLKAAFRFFTHSEVVFSLDPAQIIIGPLEEKHILTEDKFYDLQ